MPEVVADERAREPRLLILPFFLLLAVHREPCGLAGSCAGNDGIGRKGNDGRGKPTTSQRRSVERPR